MKEENHREHNGGNEHNGDGCEHCECDHQHHCDKPRPEHLPSACSDHEGCSHLKGMCCPTHDAIFLACCSSSMKTSDPTESATFSPAPTLEPTVFVDPKCSSHAACTHLDGVCCPSEDHVFLSCCYENSMSQAPSTAPSEDVALALPTTKPTAQYVDPHCSVYPACSHLDGLCCPSQDNVVLDCCLANATPSTVPTPTPSELMTDPSCTAHPACSHLVGICCPTTDGIVLDCCNETMPSESSTVSMIPTINPTGPPSSDPSQYPTYFPNQEDPTGIPTYMDKETVAPILLLPATDTPSPRPTAVTAVPTVEPEVESPTTDTPTSYPVVNVVPMPTPVSSKGAHHAKEHKKDKGSKMSKYDDKKYKKEHEHKGDKDKKGKGEKEHKIKGKKDGNGQKESIV